MRKTLFLIAGGVLTLGLLASQAPRFFGGTHAVPAAHAPVLPSPGSPDFLPPEVVHQFIEAGYPIHIGDVRKVASFERRHIQGALSLPLTDIETWGSKRSKDELLILYCT